MVRLGRLTHCSPIPERMTLVLASLSLLWLGETVKRAQQYENKQAVALVSKVPQSQNLLFAAVSLVTKCCPNNKSCRIRRRGCGLEVVHQYKDVKFVVEMVPQSNFLIYKHIYTYICL